MVFLVAKRHNQDHLGDTDCKLCTLKHPLCGPHVDLLVLAHPLWARANTLHSKSEKLRVILFQLFDLGVCFSWLFLCSLSQQFPKPAEAAAFCYGFAAAPALGGAKIWGPTPAFYHVLRGQTRERLLLQGEKNVDIQAYLRAWLSGVKIPGGVRLVVDVDPVSFFEFPSPPTGERAG